MIGLCRGAVLLALLLLGFSGCASVHVDVNPNLDWAKVKTLALQEPAEDRWGLTPLMVTELRQQGFAVIQGSESEADLLLRYQTKAKPDLDAEGNVSERLESVHLQFLDPASDKRQAVIDYFYPTSDSSHSIADGIQAALAGLRQAHPAPQSASKPDNPTAKKHSPAVVSTQVRPGADVAEQPGQPTNRSTAAPSENSKPAADQSGVKHSTAVESPTHEPQPQTRSPWIPRFKSWGFDNWGEEEETSFGY